MKENTILVVTSLLSVLLGSFHLSDDIARGFEPGGVSNFNGVLILAVWLYATLMLAERRAGYAIMLLASIGAAGVPYLHMMGAGLISRRVANFNGIFFWVWTLMALGVTGIVSVILSARGLWRSFRRRQPR